EEEEEEEEEKEEEGRPRLSQPSSQPGRRPFWRRTGAGSRPSADPACPERRAPPSQRGQGARARARRAGVPRSAHSRPGLSEAWKWAPTPTQGGASTGGR
ncbi:unnamed protein product, partial [Prorocentrum cordatum]